MNDGDTHNGPSEQVEAKYPLLVERYTLRPDSGGAGRFRGRLGTEQVVQSINQINFSSQMDRVKCKPWGLFDGLSGEGNSVAISRGGADKETHFPNGKALNQVLKQGDAYILRSGGGGGYGSPLERDLESLARDVRCGYVTREQAESKSIARSSPRTARSTPMLPPRTESDMLAKGLPIDEPLAPTPVFPESMAPAPQPVRNEIPGKLSEEERVAFAMNCRCCS